MVSGRSESKALAALKDERDNFESLFQSKAEECAELAKANAALKAQVHHILYTHVYTCTHMYIHVYTCTHMYTHVYTCTHTYVHVHCHVCVHVRMYVCYTVML